MAVTKERFEELLKSGSIPEDALQTLIDEYDPIIHVDRTAPVVYPDWVEKALHPQFEHVGPSDYDITGLEQWLHSKQVKGYATGNEIYDELIAKEMLSGCLGLSDLLAIQKRGIRFFRKHFSGKVPFGWRDVVQLRNGYRRVPYLIEIDGKVLLFWHWLDDHWYSCSPPLRFSK